MNPARGLPDLGSPLGSSGVRFFPSVDEPDHLIHVPDALEIAPRAGEPDLPDLSVEVVRGQSPFHPPEPYGVLDFRVRPPQVGLDILQQARAEVPGATVKPAVFHGGHLRLALVAGSSAADEATIADLETASPVTSNGLDGGRVIRRMTPQAALLLREVLKAGALTFVALAEMSLRGLADRVPAKVSFDPPALLETLSARADEQSRISYEAIVALWADEGAVPLAAAEGLDGVDRTRLARALADWTVAFHAEPAAAAGVDVIPTVRIRPDTAEPERTTWDLSRGRRTWRIVVLRLDPFAAARRLAGGDGLARFWSETVVPPLDPGGVDIEVDTNLPDPMLGVLEAGVELQAPPNPPHRVHALSGVVLFGRDTEAQRITWRLAPGEPLGYQYSTFVVVQRSGSVQRLQGVARTIATPWLLVGVADLPVQLVSVGAGPGLLRHAVIRGVCRSDEDAPGPDAGDSAAPDLAFELSTEQPQVALALPHDDTDRFRLDIQACSLADSHACVALDPLPATGVQLDLASFPQYGPQTVEVTVDFDVELPLVALDLLPADDADLAGADPPADPTQANVLAFTPSRPSRQWTFLSRSPFGARYRYRGHDQPDSAWSDLQPADRPLHVRASDMGTAATGNNPGLDHPEGFRFEGLYCYPSGDPQAYYVVPLEPQPELNGAGNPMLMVLPAGDGALLQLGTQLGPEGGSVERLRQELRRRLDLDNQAAVQIRPAPLQVERAALLVAGSPETPAELSELAQSSTSGFPPYTAVFNAPIDAGQRAAVASAQAGQEGRLQVRYEVRLGQRSLGLVTDAASWPRPDRREA